MIWIAVSLLGLSLFGIARGLYCLTRAVETLIVETRNEALITHNRHAYVRSRLG